MLRILLADDDDRLRASLRQALEAAGCSVVTAANGLVADRLAGQSAFDAIVTDILMPEMDGLELIRSIRRRDDGIRIVAMLETAQRHSEAFRLSLSSTAVLFGADGIVTKPVSAQSILSAITGASRRERLHMSEI